MSVYVTVRKQPFYYFVLLLLADSHFSNAITSLVRCVCVCVGGGGGQTRHANHLRVIVCLIALSYVVHCSPTSPMTGLRGSQQEEVSRNEVCTCYTVEGESVLCRIVCHHMVLRGETHYLFSLPQLCKHVNLHQHHIAA